MENTADLEISTMSALAAALDAVKDDKEVLKRVLHWAVSRYAGGDIDILLPSTKRRNQGQGGGGDESGGENGGLAAKFSDVAELFNTADPKTEWQKALVIGYWLMKGASQEDFTGADVHDQLKDLGHPVGNITDALNKAMQRKPALVLQVAKGGTSKQARKKYRVTRAGITAVEAMIKGEKASEE
jgi:hypothetical protein